tara:strand:+ start:202 stop:432 length:231 start_codon:yes stop_codon:yes gene_type:complete
MNTAKQIIKKCGGVAATAAMTGRTASSVYKWTYTKKQGGTDGIIPRAAQEKILAATKSGLVDVSIRDFYVVDKAAQ